MGVRPRRQTPSRVATAFVLIGTAAVLGATFAAGVSLGRWWSSPAPARHGEPVAGGDADGRRAVGGHAEKPKSAMPALTFYQELTAPLTAPPPPPKPKAAHGDGPRIVVRDTPSGHDTPTARELPAAHDVAVPPEANVPSAAPARAVLAASDEGAPRSYTVQVGAYKSREPAEALRAKLVAAGHAAELFTAEAATGARFRVRIGSYPTRDAARQAAARIAAERALPTLVTAR